jgi:hypothetical protein
LILPLVLRLRGGGYPKYIVDQAARLNNEHVTVESKFHALYLNILSYWFPSADGYHVFPHWPVPDATEDRHISFVIKLPPWEEPPFLLLEVKPPSDFHLDQ